MEDLLESIHWSGCEVLNATKTDAVGSLLKQGLRDQELMIVESDADEQLLGWHRARCSCQLAPAAGILSLSLSLSLAKSLSFLARLSPALYLLGPYRRFARCSDICTPRPVLNSAATNTVLSRVYPTAGSSSSRSNESTKGVV
jgi:hypothetical protein